MAAYNGKYRQELCGIIGKRFLTGMEEFKKSTHDEKHEIIRIWKEKGYHAGVKARGELREDFFTEQACPIKRCDIARTHTHEDHLSLVQKVLEGRNM